MTFKVGQLVVCVDAADVTGAVLELRRIYRIKSILRIDEICPQCGCYGRSTAGIELFEVVTPPCLWHSHGYFRITRFRPVAPTSIEIFRELVKHPDPKLVDA